LRFWNGFVDPFHWVGLFSEIYKMGLVIVKYSSKVGDVKPKFYSQQRGWLFSLYLILGLMLSLGGY